MTADDFYLSQLSVLNIVQKASYDMDTRENRPVTAKENRNRNFDAAFGKIFRISNCFQQSKQKINK
jgi:hypothetical protein